MRLVQPQDDIVNRLVDRRSACASRNIYRSGDYDFFILLGFLATLAAVLIIFLQYDFAESHLIRRSTSSAPSNDTVAHEDGERTSTASTDNRKGKAQRLPPKVTVRGASGHASRRHTVHSVKYCEGSGCKDIADRITSSVNPMLNPCSDFYQFVCNSWLNRTQLSVGQAKMSEEDVTRMVMEKQLVAELKVGTDDGSLKWPYRLWEACRSGKGEPRADHTFINILKAHDIKDFPYRTDVGLNLSRTAAKVLKFSGIAALVDVGVEKGAGSKAFQKWVLRIDPPRTIFQGFVKMRDIHDEWYLAAVERISDTRYLPKLLKLEQALVELAGERRDVKNYVRTSVGKLLRSRHWDWKVFLGALFKGVSKIYKDTEVLIKGSSFQRRFIKMINSFGAATILNYLTFRMHIQYALFLNFDDFLEIATISGAITPGWEDGDPVRDAADFRCLRLLTRTMPELYAYVYWNAYLRNRHQTMTALDALVEYTVNDAITMAQQLNVTPQLVRQFRDDLFSLQKQLFVPDWLERRRPRTQFAKMLFEDAEDSILMSWNGILASRQRNIQRKLVDSGFETFWHGDLLDRDPWMDFDEKLLHVPAAAVEYNYTGDAFMVQHIPRLGLDIARMVMGHLADLAFQQRTKVPSVHLKLEFLKDCLRKQYYRNRPSNDVASRGDALDLLALPVALKVFQKHAARGSGIFKLRQVPAYASDQLFFIEFALNRCEKYEDSYFHQRMHHGFISPAPYRVNGPLKNMPEFAEAFHCPAESEMKPKRRCGFLPANHDG